jgi:hypothetical protein
VIKQRGKIYVAFTSTDLRNINYDLALEFARYLNVELVEVTYEWDQVIMRNGSVPGGASMSRLMMFRSLG